MSEEKKQDQQYIEIKKSMSTLQQVLKKIENKLESNTIIANKPNDIDNKIKISELESHKK